MATNSFTFLSALLIFTALQLPGTSAWFWFEEPETVQTKPREVVDKHNDLRRRVSPPARNMQKMSWSTEAAANAQKWAETCSLKHSSQYARKISSHDCGENIYMSDRKPSWSYVIQKWYDEEKHYLYGKGSTNGKAVGHYTQIVWATSNQVGCGAAHCPNSDYEYFYVCQYCPPGNYRNTLPYKSGRSCGDCPHDCDNKLCTASCPYSDKVSNCASLKKKWGCKQEDVASWCPASCKCKINN